MGAIAGTVATTPLVFARSSRTLDVLVKRLRAKEGTSLGTVSSLMCSAIFFRNFNPKFDRDGNVLAI
jgi:hypothetical protein